MRFCGPFLLSVFVRVDPRFSGGTGEQLANGTGLENVENRQNALVAATVDVVLEVSVAAVVEPALRRHNTGRGRLGLD
jgi:hypothetical protein